MGARIGGTGTRGNCTEPVEIKEARSTPLAFSSTTREMRVVNVAQSDTAHRLLPSEERRVKNWVSGGALPSSARMQKLPFNIFLSDAT